MPMNFKHLKELIDENGELRIPETINLCDFDGPNLNYRLESIGANAFNGLTKLKKVFIPATCTTINCNFYQCYNLSEINVDESNPSYCSLDGVLFTKNMKMLVAYPNAHGNNYCIPEGVYTIGRHAFLCCSIEEIHLSSSVRTININAFYECNCLKTVYLPDDFKTLNKQPENLNSQCVFVFKRRKYSYLEALDIFKNPK